MRRGVVGATGVAAFAAMLASLATAQALPPPAAPGDIDKLPAGAGRDTMVRVCSGCHTPAIVVQQRLTPDGWAVVVEQMAGNGAQGTDADFAAIKDYLATSFPAKAVPPTPS